MKKLLCGFLSTAMLVSLCATSAMAESTSTHQFTILKTLRSDGTGDGDGLWQNTDYSKLKLTIDEDTEDDEPACEVIIGKEFKTPNSDNPESIAQAIDGETFSSVEFNKKTYTVTLIAEPGNGNASLKAEFNPAEDMTKGGKKYNFENTAIQLSAQKKNDTSFDLTTTAVPISFIVPPANSNDIIGGPANIEASGDLEVVDILDAVYCDENSNPIPLTEKPAGTEQDQNGEQGVQSNKTLYFMIQDGEYHFDNETYWNLKVSKGKNSKIIKSVTDISKSFGTNLYNVYSGGEVEDSSGRHRFIKVELNELYTDDEYKIALNLILTARTAAERIYGIEGGSSLKVNDFTFYVKNLVKNTDSDWKVGISGLMLNPISNDWNNVTYYDEDGDVAFVKFFGDSDTDKFYAKLSTKWTHADYAAYFNDQDAYYFEFTGSPKLSSTSRADLEIYNPFTDKDGNETIDPTTATIYQVIDGDLVDVTDRFTYGEGKNGDMTFKARTRFIGTYIICEKPVVIKK